MEKIISLTGEFFGFKRYQITHGRFYVRLLKRRWAEMFKRCFFAALLSLLLVFVWSTSLGVSGEQFTLRNLFFLRGPVVTPENLFLIGIDDRTFKDLGASPRWPLPRKHFASALEAIAEAQPELVILDLTAFREGQDKEANQRIINALKSGKVTIAKGFIPKEGKSEVDAIALEVDPAFGEAASFTVDMFLTAENDTLWSLSAVPRSDLEATGPEAFPIFMPLRSVYPELKAPPRGSLINFYGPPGTIPRASMSEFITGDKEALKEKLRGKVVIVGFQSVARMRGQLYQEDFPTTASKDTMYGVEIHANIVGNLLEENWIKRFPVVTEQFLIFATFFIFVVVALSLTVGRSWLLGLGVITAWAALTYILFTFSNTLLPGLIIVFFGVLLFLGPISLLRAMEDKYELDLINKRLGLKKKNPAERYRK